MRRAARTPIAGVMFALVLAGCTTAVKETAPASVRNGELGVEDLTATLASSARITLAGNEDFLPPLAEPGNRPPAYPAELLAQRLTPQAVCLRVSVDEEGEMTSSSPFVRPPDCVAPDAAAQSFLGAARVAVSAWRYDPAVRCVFERGPRPDHATCVGAREAPQAVSLTYRFVFEQQNGHGSVRTTP